MKKTIKNNEKGITLIALVITIIVLLILAGVSILMLSGENGILRQAANAKTEYDVSSNKEVAILDSTELQIDLLTERKNKLKCAYGMVAGIEIGTKVSSLQDELPKGYTILALNGNEISNKQSTNVATGMQVVKNNKIMSRIVIYGDVNCNGIVDGLDAIDIEKFIKKINGDNWEDWQIVAANVISDEELNRLDSKTTEKYSVGLISNIQQSAPPKLADELVRVTKQEAIDKYLDNLPSDLKNNIEIKWQSEGEYLIYVEKDSIDAETFINYLKNDTAGIYDWVYNEDEELDKQVQLNPKDYIEQDDFLTMKLYGSNSEEEQCIVFKIK